MIRDFISFYNRFILQLVSVYVLAVSFVLEIFFNIQPCMLCSWQRLGWVITVFLALIFKNKFILVLPLLGTLGVALYQVAIQYGILNYTCPINFNSNTPTIPCDQIDFSIFGVSLAGINAIICFILIICVILYSDNDNSKKKNGRYN